MMKRKYWGNGNIKSEAPTNHQGQFHGIIKQWYKEGQLNYETSYHEGQIHGIIKGWRCDGEILYERYWLYNNEVTPEEYRHHELVVKLSGL